MPCCPWRLRGWDLEQDVGSAHRPLRGLDCAGSLAGAAFCCLTCAAGGFVALGYTPGNAFACAFVDGEEYLPDMLLVVGVVVVYVCCCVT